MRKPEKQTKSFYDYRQCRDYLQDKYGYQERDYLGMFKDKKTREDVEYLDFWHWVCDHHDIHNGCEITFSNEEYDGIEEGWVKEIYKHYMDEFSGVENWETSEDYASVDFYVSW